MRIVVGTYLTVECPGCNNEQIVFSKASTRIDCIECETTLAEPRGGEASLSGDIVEVHEDR